MEVLDYDSFLKRVIELKMKGKKISEFLTSGKLHAGHIQGIELCRQNSDVVTVVFCDYLQNIFFQIGLEGNSYTSERINDLNILEKLGVVDLVTSRSYDESISNDLFEMRKIVVKEIANLVSGGYLPNFYRYPKIIQIRVISSIAVGLRTNPEEKLCDIEYWGDNNFYFNYSLLIGKKYGFYMPYNFYPIIRDEKQLPIQSRNLNQKSEKFCLFRDEVSKVLQDSLNQVIKTGETKNIDKKKVFLQIIEQESLKKSDRLITGKRFFIMMLYEKDHKFFDIARINA